MQPENRSFSSGCQREEIRMWGRGVRGKELYGSEGISWNPAQKIHGGLWGWKGQAYSKGLRMWASRERP